MRELLRLYREQRVRQMNERIELLDAEIRRSTFLHPRAEAERQRVAIKRVNLLSKLGEA